MYDEATWDAVFKKPLVKEMFEAGGLLGELNHPEDRLETEEKNVLSFIGTEPVHLEYILNKTGLPVSSVQSFLMLLELKGFIEKLPGDRFVRK